ncbi:MAG: four helix bundle protein [Chloroflexota bacterium]
MQNFKNLAVWNKAHGLTLDVYKLTKQYPSDERFQLVSQMRRSASSIPTNIAEGSGRSSDADFARFLHNSLGSSTELEYQLILSKDLNYIDVEDWKKLDTKIGEIRRMLIAFIKKLKASS